MRGDGVGGQPDQLYATLCEFGLEFCEGAQLGGADGGVVFGVGEEDDPVVADEVVEVDGAVGSFSLEVRGYGAEAEAARSVSMDSCFFEGASKGCLRCRSFF